MRILAVDIGTVRLGLAISDPLGITAQPLPTRPGGGVKQICKTVLETVLEYEKATQPRGRIETVVIGHPLHLDGSPSDMSAMAEECARRLRQYFRQHVSRYVDVVLRDERLTSVAAERVLLAADLSRGKRRQKRDQVAAQLILQGYLDAQRIQKTEEP